MIIKADDPNISIPDGESITPDSFSEEYPTPLKRFRPIKRKRKKKKDERKFERKKYNNN